MLIDPPQLTNVAESHAASIYVKTPREQITQVMGPGIHELMDVLNEQQISPTGPWYCYHLTCPAENFEFEISLPVTQEIRPSRRVENRFRPAQFVAKTTYRGPYEGLPDAWGEFQKWIHSEKLQPAGHFWEVYSQGPETGLPPEQWVTELVQPLIR
ncbi:GyrI-like domain-containing protein [Planctomicrobium sp. SH668]|uniref:GyrI-like domain-containing protein n=1 Tax=Planctomicrobium sp. SH668 TaxID=3448126 RepID=UPI003F5B66C0